MEQQAPAQAPGMSDEVRSLWIGDLQYWMDESYLRSCFTQSRIKSAKVIRNKLTGVPEGYGFVEFESHAAADLALQSFSGTIMPQTDQPFRLNWACFGGDKRDNGSDDSIFVGDLANDVTDTMLLETFKSRYPSVKSAKVVVDAITGRGKGYGFVRFGDEAEKNSAMTEMDGEFCSSRPMRVCTATPKKTTQQHSLQRVQYQFTRYGAAPIVDDDSTNTTIFVGGLDLSATEDDLRKVFSPFGDIASIKIPSGRRCGFVQFTTRSSAEEALKKVQGSVIGQQNIRLSWGRHPGNKQRYPSWYKPYFDSQWHGVYQLPYGYVYSQYPPVVYSGYHQQVN